MRVANAKSNWDTGEGGKTGEGVCLGRVVLAILVRVYSSESRDECKAKGSAKKLSPASLM
jgi:hypothetical protein